MKSVFVIQKLEVVSRCMSGSTIVGPECRHIINRLRDRLERKIVRE